MENNSSPVTQEHLAHAYDYASYKQMIEALFAEGKTTGENHSADMLHYTKMNMQRMKRVEKTTTVLPELEEAVKALTAPQVWLVLTEAWCGDAAQSVPALQKVAALSPHIAFRLLLRDEHPELMDAFLTNSTRSIPKLILLDTDTLQVLGSWGPRPYAAQQIVDAHKQKGTPYGQYAEEVHKWYAVNKTEALQGELLHLLQTIPQSVV